ncbi:MAG: L,D-transpeptidase [Acidobacteriota bacterium]
MSDNDTDHSSPLLRGIESTKKEHARRVRRTVLVLLIGTGLLCAAVVLFVLSTGYGYADLNAAYISRHSMEVPQTGPVLPEKILDMAEKKLDQVRPKGIFVVVDHIRNHLYLRDGDKVILDALCSAGAGTLLTDPKSDRHWVFDTPVGRFFVRDKRKDPTWTAPDWDYIESGEPFPKNYADRVQEGMLGEYALDLGGGPSGYMIHGTLYTRLLGRNVSHGCVRVGRDDLRIIWQKVPVGATVFMY